MKRIVFAIVTICSSLTAIAQKPKLVADMNYGAASSSPDYLTAFGSKLYFCATDGTHGHEFYSYDTVSGPVMIADIVPGSGNGIPISNPWDANLMGKLGSKLCFAAGGPMIGGTELWSFDTTSGVYTMVDDIYPGTNGSYPQDFVTFGNKVYFSAESPASGQELYSYDGVNPPVLFDINPGVLSSSPRYITPFNGKLYFQASDTIHGAELWVLDTLTGLPSMIQDILPGRVSSLPSYLTVAGNKLYFSAQTLASSIFSSATELYSYDGTAITILTDFSANGQGVVAGAYTGFSYYKGDIYFKGSSSIVTTQLYKYSPGTGATSMVYDLYPNGDADIDNFRIFNNVLYFSATSDAGNELWAYDGANCNMVADLAPGTASSNPSNLTIYNNSLYFAATDGVSGTELYKLGDNPTSIRNITFNGSVSVYPNPANDHCILSLTLMAPQALNLTITDATGRVVYSSGITNYPQGESRSAIEVNHLKSGEYFYRVADARTRQVAAGSLQISH